MTKSELIAKVAQSANLSKTEASQTLNSVLEIMQDALIEEGKVILTGFGMFWTEKKEERQGHNPRTGEAITVPARTVIRFKPYSQFKNKIQ